MIQAEASNRTLQDLHNARSRLIDAFGDVELELVRLLSISDKKIRLAPLSQKIAAVRKIEASPRYSRKQRADVAEALDLLEPLLPRRAEVAHSSMSVVRIEKDEMLAGFCNPAAAASHGRTLQVYTLEQLTRFTKEVRDIAARLRAATSPPCAQRPPSPVAAVDP